MLNKKQALELFEREVVCFGNHDGVPLSRVRELFGENAAKSAVREPGKYYNWFNIEKYECQYLYLAGFLYAATYANMEKLQTKEARS